MQLTLAFLEPPLPPQQQPSKELPNVEAFAEARNILARIIAQAFVTANQTEARDE